MAHSHTDHLNPSLPHGTCPGVGIGGHGTLGGFGYNGRIWGLLVDRIVKLDVVLANGTSASVSATEHPDLFWALRGAGPGFALVVNFYLLTFAAPPSNINYAYTYSYPSASAAASGFQYATNWPQQNAPKELGFGIFLSAGNTFVVQGVYSGTLSAFNSLFAPFLAGMQALQGGKPPVFSPPKALGWIDSLTALGGAPTLTTPPAGDGLHDIFVSHSTLLHPPPLTQPLTHTPHST